MKMNLSSFLFLSTLVAGTLLAVTSTTWLGVWMGLEMNLLSFIPLMAQKNKFSAEAALKYFLTQAFASVVLLLGILWGYMGDLEGPSSYLLLNQVMVIAVLTKMGAAPTHFWFPEVAGGLDWGSNMLLMTWQKIAPFIALVYLQISLMLMSGVVMMSSLFGALGGFNQTSLRKILAFSSINHMAWMVVSTKASQMMWNTYFMVYSILTLTMMMFFKYYNLNVLSQLAGSSSLTPLESFLISLNMLSMGGLPPFLGFLPKWMIMEYMINEHLYLLVLFMIMMTLIVLYFYLRLTYSSFMFYSSSWKIYYMTAHPKFNFLLWLTICGLAVGPFIVFW